MPFDSSNIVGFPRRANVNAPPAPLDEDRAFSHVPQVRLPVRPTVLYRSPAFTAEQQARADLFAKTGKTPDQEQRDSAKMFLISLVGGWLLILAGAIWLGIEAHG